MEGVDTKMLTTGILMNVSAITLAVLITIYPDLHFLIWEGLVLLTLFIFGGFCGSWIRPKNYRSEERVKAVTFGGCMLSTLVILQTVTTVYVGQFYFCRGLELVTVICGFTWAVMSRTLPHPAALRTPIWMKKYEDAQE